jgi:putative NADH-flavin reductase
MAKVVLFGATGFVGGKILDEAVGRGHDIVAVARNGDAIAERDGVSVRAGSLHDDAFLTEVVKGADVVISAIPGRELEGKRLIDAVPSLVRVAKENGARIGVVGGAGTLQVTEGGPRLMDAVAFQGSVRDEAVNHANVLAALRELPEGVDWFYVSPGTSFGARVPGTRTGKYRVGDDVVLKDENGDSAIGGDDFALAFVDEIEKPAHHRRRFTVAY